MGTVVELNTDFMPSRAGSASDQIVVIRDNSIFMILVLSALTILALLALARVLADKDGPHAHTLPPQVISFPIKTKQKLEKSPSAAGATAEVQPAAVRANGQTEKTKDPQSTAPATWDQPREKTASATLEPSRARGAPAGADLLQKDVASIPPESSKVKTTPAAMPPSVSQMMRAPRLSAISAEGSKDAGIVITTIRGGRHPEYASIVFQASGEITYDTPRINACAIRFRLADTETRLSSFRRYKTFDSWVQLKKAGPDLDVVVGLLPGLIKFSVFSMENPPRLVVNLYDGGPLR